MSFATPVYAMGSRPLSEPGDAQVKVAVAQGQENVALMVRGGYTLQALGTGEAVADSAQGMDVLSLTPHDSGLLLNGERLGLFGLRLCPLKEGNLWVDGKRLRGNLCVLREKDRTLTVINEVGVENYLAGVMRGELPKGWPAAAYEAQAIASRTFALYRTVERFDRDYALTSDVSSQVYEGKSAETWASNKAVRKTAGKVLTWEGRIFPAFYHSDSGGHTQSAHHLWKVDIAPLAGVPSPYGEGSPYAHWEFSVKAAGLGWAFRQKGYAFQGGVEDWEILDRDVSGRIQRIRFIGSGEPLTLSGAQLREVLGVSRLRSTQVELRKEGELIFFAGSGWGHGVGMSQWGAYDMANQGYSAEEILAHYYPGAQIRDWREVFEAGAWGIKEEQLEAWKGQQWVRPQSKTN
ncbi:MAG: SpoIID/LytB domain-containing protein [Candidatus Omnitrophica bacterium]|nr:SpoIID/LytB domain-containing protein [Candidatus Omnitrophota bacterium]